MFLFGVTPLEAWIVLLVGSLIPTIFIYRVLGKVVENSATLKGTLAGYTVELAGPVAFYVILLVLGKGYIPLHTEITLQGSVKNVDGQLLSEYEIAVVDLRAFGKTFDINAEHNDHNAYSFLIWKDGIAYLIRNQPVNDTKTIMLESFPDVEVTKIKSEEPLKDQRGQQLPNDYSIEIIPIIRPNPAFIRDGKVELSIEHGKYKMLVRDSQSNIRAEEFLTDVSQGDRAPLPNPINIR